MAFKVRAFGEAKTISDWARDPRCLVLENVLRNRTRLGWSLEKAMLTPKRPIRNNDDEEPQTNPSVQAMLDLIEQAEMARDALARFVTSARRVLDKKAKRPLSLTEQIDGILNGN